MPGINWPYETLCWFASQPHRSTSSRLTETDINPMVKRLLITCPGSTIFGAGGRSVLLSLGDSIAAKVALKPGDEHLRLEQKVLELVDHAPCSSIMQPIFSAPDIIFMPLCKNGDLQYRMDEVDKPRPVLAWMQQLSEAAACLESIGYAHGDIHPRNILVDDDDQLKLVDFDHALEIGGHVDVGYEPYVRLHTAAEMGYDSVVITDPPQDLGGTYGNAGPATEQFALGSVFWLITRGSELYGDLEGPDQLDRLMRHQYPETDPNDPIDEIISSCWNSRFQSIAQLSKQVKKVARTVNNQEKRAECPD
jgi:serine/threonine protein kinase